MIFERWSSKGIRFSIKKVGIFSKKSPTFGVWLPIADGCGHLEEKFEAITTIDSGKIWGGHLKI